MVIAHVETDGSWRFFVHDDFKRVVFRRFWKQRKEWVIHINV